MAEKFLELVIRTQADDDKLREMLESGWEIKDKGTLISHDEPDRIFYWLVKVPE